MNMIKPTQTSHKVCGFKKTLLPLAVKIFLHGRSTPHVLHTTESLGTERPTIYYIFILDRYYTVCEKCRIHFPYGYVILICCGNCDDDTLSQSPSISPYPYIEIRCVTFCSQHYTSPIFFFFWDFSWWISWWRVWVLVLGDKWVDSITLRSGCSDLCGRDVILKFRICYKQNNLCGA